jgi:hypothetical protein
MPARGRRGHEHLPRASRGLPKNFPAAAQAPAAACSQVLEIRPRRCLHNGDARPIGFQLLSQNHGERGTDALAHFRFTDRQRDGPIFIDSDPAIGPKFTSIARRYRANYSSRSVKAENERDAAKRARFYKSATRRSHPLYFGISAAAR